MSDRAKVEHSRLQNKYKPGHPIFRDGEIGQLLIFYDLELAQESCCPNRAFGSASLLEIDIAD